MPEFVFGDKLPWISEVVLAIMRFAPGGPPDGPNQTQKRKEGVTDAAWALHELWVSGLR